MNISIQELVRKDLLHREQLGIARYGTPLYPYNGREALVDAYEEALDLSVYLRQALAEAGIDPNRHINPPPTQQRCDCISDDSIIPEYGQ